MDKSGASRARYARNLINYRNMLGFKEGGDITQVAGLKEFDDHELVSFGYDKETGLTAVIAVHRANPEVPSFGATRLWQYAASIEGVKDALRLSRGMSYKAALAGLNCGGAKGVIIANSDIHKLKNAEREKLLEAYAARVNILGGRFVTGTDVGIRQSDLEVMRRKCRHIIGFNDNSTEFTAIGVFEGLKAALSEVFGSPEPKGHSFAIQGLGKVGGGLLSYLYESVGPGGQIYVSDIDEELVEKIKAKYPRIIPVASDKIATQEVDVFAPCALSGAVNKKNSDALACKIVAGGANNQLESDSVGDRLFERGILYAPDYVLNAGGLIAVFDEYKHQAYDRARVEKAVLHIPETLKKIFAESRAEKIAPSRAANRIAEGIFNGYSNAG